MRALVCRDLGSPDALTIEDWPEPVPGPGEVLVRPEAWSLNHVDILMVQGLYQHKPALPFVPGLEAAGRVVAVADDVTTLRPGDRVITHHRPGAFAEGVIASEAETLILPDAVPFTAGAAFRSIFMTAHHALVDKARLKPGEWLLVHGASGGVGMATILLGRLHGARVIATTADPAKVDRLRAAGAETVLVLDGGPFRDQVKAATGGRGVDIVFDPLGDWIFDESMRCLAWGARLLIVGFLAGKPALARTNHLLIKGASALGIRAGEAARHQPEAARAALEGMLDEVAAGRLSVPIDRTMPFSAAAEAMRALADRRIVGKIVLVRDTA